MCYSSSFFFFNDTATTEIYTLSLHDALPIYHHIGDSAGFFQPHQLPGLPCVQRLVNPIANGNVAANERDRKSTRLNSSHGYISYAVFCLKKTNRACCSSNGLANIFPL